MKLHLGVIDVVYEAEDEFTKQMKLVRSLKNKKSRAAHEVSKSPDTGVTTGDVAEFLEKKYQVMQTFYNVMEKSITEDLTKSAENAVADLFSGADPAHVHLTFDATEQIQEQFRAFIDARAMDGLVPGVPTLASLEGKSRRFKSGYNPRGSRPSFYDSGLYEASFKAWTEE